MDKEDAEFLEKKNILYFDIDGNLLIDLRNYGDLILYDLVCDLYVKVGIDEYSEPTELGYKIEEISDYIYLCMIDIKDIEKLRIIENHEEWLILH